MMESQFQTADSLCVSASELLIGDRVLDHEGREVAVEWCAKHKKQKRLVVDFHCKLLTVTDSHRIVLQDGEIVPAKEIEAKQHKILKVSSSQFVEVEKITKRHAYVPVMELGFENDATVATCMPSILTKGADPPSGMGLESSECKEEVTNDNSMDVESAGVGVAELVAPMAGTDEAPVTGEMQRWPSTDDGF